MENKKIKKIVVYLLTITLSLFVFFICIFFGSTGFINDFSGIDSISSTILKLRLPRVICAALIGASLSVCGAAMQGLLRNPLADGSTLGVSSGASLGAVIAIIFSSTAAFSISLISDILIIVLPFVSAFLSLLIIMSLSYKVDSRLSTNTIILCGVVFSMFTSSLISLLISLFPENAKTITFWTMGSISAVSYENCIVLGIFFLMCFFILFFHAEDLNAFSLGENNASNLGVNVKRSKMLIMIVSSVLIGVSVSIAGTIAFVGLIVPHISRMIVGPNHKKLLIFSVFFGAIFLMLADLFSRVIIAPKELPIGVITSLIGAIVFITIFYRQRKGVK